MSKDHIMPAVVRAVQDNLHDPDFDVRRMARVLFMSRAQLFRRMKRECGMGPAQYLAEMRLQRAHALLTSVGARKVTEIADLCGFRDRTYFSRAVRKRFGQPPNTLQKLQDTK